MGKLIVDDYYGTIVSSIGNDMVANTSFYVSGNVHIEVSMTDRTLIFVGLDHNLSKISILIIYDTTVIYLLNGLLLIS